MFRRKFVLGFGAPDFSLDLISIMQQRAEAKSYFYHLSD